MLPRDVAFQYIGNSALIGNLTDIGVDLHLLYEYLWTHILTLHFIRESLGHNSSGGIVDRIRRIVLRDDKREIALRYLEQHADNFWITVEQVSAEFTDSVSESLSREVGLTPAAFKARIEGGESWRDEQKRTFKFRAQDAVSRLQMREMKETISALGAVAKSERGYYILIDDLDGNWGGSAETQYALIRALIESLKTFRRVSNLKIIVALREDLYEATLRSTTDKHFQAEKQEGIIARLTWSDTMIKRLIERRTDQLLKFEYTKQKVTLADILPQLVGQAPADQYIIDRTLRRPRDAIAFVNQILKENEGEALPLPARAITKVEPLYSSGRLRALTDEWRSCHPLVKSYFPCIRNFPGPFTVEDINEDRLQSLVLEVAGLDRQTEDSVERISRTLYERDKDIRLKKLARNLLVVLYKLGAIGAKLDPSEPYSYCYDQRLAIEESEITDTAKFIIHPMLASALRYRNSYSEAA